MAELSTSLPPDPLAPAGSFSILLPNTLSQNTEHCVSSEVDRGLLWCWAAGLQNHTDVPCLTIPSLTAAGQCDHRKPQSDIDAEGQKLACEGWQWAEGASQLSPSATDTQFPQS